jgi:hypothetical protein
MSVIKENKSKEIDNSQDIKEIQIKHDFSNGECIIKYNIIDSDNDNTNILEIFNINFQFINFENFKRYELFADYNYIINSNKIFHYGFDILFELIKDKPYITEKEDRLILSYNINILKKEYKIIFEIPIIQLEGYDNGNNDNIIILKKSLHKLKLKNKKLKNTITEQDKSIKSILSYLFQSNNTFYNMKYKHLEQLVKCGLDFTDINNINHFVNNFSINMIIETGSNVNDIEEQVFGFLDCIGENILNSDKINIKNNILFNFIDQFNFKIRNDNVVEMINSDKINTLKNNIFFKVFNYLMKYKLDVNKKYNYGNILSYRGSLPNINMSVIEYINICIIENKKEYFIKKQRNIVNNIDPSGHNYILLKIIDLLCS